MHDDHFELFNKKMRKEGIPDIVINNFKEYYEQLRKDQGNIGLIIKKDILPIDSLPDSENLDEELIEIGERAVRKTVMIKLNGGLGTGMGLDKAKSLLIVKNNMSFLDITIRQAIRDNIPLILMNSFVTRDDSLKIMQKSPRLRDNIPHDFLQNRIPKIMKEDLRPARSENEELNWCPPGHGDIYVAMHTSGILDRMIDEGYEYAFISNSDNLGAVMNRSILGYFVKNEIPFMMETADRTDSDKKGGHLAIGKDGKLVLREIAQCPIEELEEFQDISKYRFFNTNNIWVNLIKLKSELVRNGGRLPLTLICNEKNLNPRDMSSPLVYQLETAMGSAISVFVGAKAIRVPRSRFLPVKKTSDLLNVMSDNFILTENFEVVKNPEAENIDTYVDLDPRYYKLVDEMTSRFLGTPSLAFCKKLIVKGDVHFGKDVIIKGDVRIENRKEIPFYIKDGTIIEKDIIIA